MKEIIYNLLIGMRDELRSENRCPQFLCYTDILVRSNISRADLNKILNELFIERKIRVRKGLNDKLIEILNDDRRIKRTKQ